MIEEEDLLPVEESESEPDFSFATVDEVGANGVTLVLDGPLPAREPFKHILATAMHECLTNTLRHAHGDTLYLTVRDREDGLTVVFTNNGTQPETPVQERGGLTALRKLTEEAGGTMEVVSQPAITVTLKLPKEVEHAL